MILFVFPSVFAGDDALKHVFPSKQKAAQQAINLAKQDHRIQRLIVFGSAVTLDCGTGSDLDLAVDAPDVTEEEFLEIAHAFYLGVDSEIDLIHYNSIHSPLLKKEIDGKGVPVYVFGS